MERDRVMQEALTVEGSARRGMVASLVLEVQAQRISAEIRGHYEFLSSMHVSERSTWALE